MKGLFLVGVHHQIVCNRLIQELIEEIRALKKINGANDSASGNDAKYGNKNVQNCTRLLIVLSLMTKTKKWISNQRNK